MSVAGSVLARPAALAEVAALRALRLTNRWPPLFVVGVPRSGTTAVYLHLVNRFEVAYFPNVAKANPYACVLAAAGGRALLSRHRQTYTHRYGNVEGAMAPSDGWDIFNRWFPHYGHEGPRPGARLHELRTIVALYERIFRAPFLNKNNANSTRVPDLAGLFPGSLFVRVRRDPVPTTLSLLEAREANAVAVGEWWSAAPPQFHADEFTDPVEQAVAQVWGVGRALDAALDALPRVRWITVDYEQVCSDPGPLERWVRDRWSAAGVALRTHTLPPGHGLRPSRGRDAEATVAARIRELLAVFDTRAASSAAHAGETRP